MLGGMASLWRTKEYLMQVSSTGYSETYKRFYFSDIQGFLLLPSRRRSNYYLALPVLFLPFLLASVVAASWVPSAVGLGVAALLALWNGLKGPSCNLYLVTRVQTARLEAIGRRRTALKLIDILRGTILVAQQPPPLPYRDAPPPAVPGSAPTL
jgi:hypothetical protein